MGQFSDDGQWWWDGHTWTASSQVVIPDLPVVDQQGVETMHTYRIVGQAAFYSGLAEIGSDKGVSGIFLIPFLLFQRRTFRAYRASMLKQLEAATTYLLGSDEPMIAGEVSIYPSYWAGLLRGDLALAVTRAHVLIVRVDVSSGRVRWVVLAARPAEVNIGFHWGFLWGYPTLYVHHRSGVYPIRGSWGIVQREPILTAWREAIAHPVGAMT